MPPVIEYSTQAQLDLDEILEYYLLTVDEDTAIKAITAILTEIDYLTNTPMLGRDIASEAPQYRVWPVFRSRYKIYFERVATDHIKVIRVYGSKRKPLGTEEITKM